MAPPKQLLLPMKVDAFIFNGAVCEGKPGQAKIAPITQPNYTFLQLNNYLAQPDILDHVDLHNSAPASRNPRYMDIGKGAVRANRLGAYIHWTLPRPLRSGEAVSETRAAANAAARQAAGEKDDKDNENADPSSITYPALPNRWLVIRTLDPCAETTLPKRPPGLKAVTSWVIESDLTRSIDEIPESADLEVDVAPFITSFVPPEADKGLGDISVEQQAEIFIGRCVDADIWAREQEPGGKAAETLPRVSLTAASSSNQLFLDYQSHCGSVFSMLDTFTYAGEGGASKRLTSAVADYYIIGWHDKASDDLLGRVGEGSSRKARLDALRVSILGDKPAADKDAIAKWLAQHSPARTLCHGAMYSVKWNSGLAPAVRPADTFATSMAESMPLAVGTTPLDAVLAYISARDKQGSVEAGILALQRLLRAEDDGVDAQMAAEDEVQGYNYVNTDGGNHFFLAAEDGGAKPPAEKRKGMRGTNNVQHLLDAVRRRIKQLRWRVFSWWWKYISDVDNAPTIAQDKEGDLTITEIQDLIRNLVKMESILKDRIGKPALPIKAGVMEAFHQRNDPTLVIGGLKSGWPSDFNDDLAGRLDNQTVVDQAAPSPLPDLPKEAHLDCLPKDLQDAGAGLLREFLALKKDAGAGERVPPLYHDERDKKQRDQWGDSQPWFPLYLEWEAEYSHIPFDSWSLQTRAAKSGLKDKFAYVLKKDVRKPPNEQYADVRYVSGRTLLLPQPSFSLRVHIERLFATIPPHELDLLLSAEQRAALIANLDQLAFLSVPLAGLTDHLLTRYQGAHVKPLVRQPGMQPVVLNEAENMVRHLNVDLAHVGQESDPTPYGSLATLVGNDICGFKPATHGQLRFMKLNVVDKFGQVVHAVDPLPEDPPAVYPSVGELYAIDPVPGNGNGDKPNVIDPSRSTLGRPEYLQLPPAINQSARINAHFVVRDTDDATVSDAWRPATEFDEPIWGWVVVNYADHGLQFFLPDGTFYREVRSTKSAISWLPFAAPAAPIVNNEQLDSLIGQLLGSAKYLRAFMDMIMTALRATVPAPSAYGQFVNSLIGRPLALANTGWSLELATASYRNESTVPDQRPDRAKMDTGLLEGDAPKQYDFPLKLGDRAANYDGLVGYLRFRRVKNPGAPKDDPGRLEMDASKIYTYFTSKSLDSDPLAPIDPRSFPKLKAFWVDPSDHQPVNNSDAKVDLAAGQFERERNKHLTDTLVATIFDPFAPITGYTAILPVRQLRLANWTWETSLKRITAFFHAGPVVLTNDVPKFNADLALGPEDYDVAGGKKIIRETPVKMPAMTTGEWAWLMPYDLKSEKDPRQAYMGIEVAGGEALERPVWTSGPMTAIEGSMQLATPIEKKRDQKDQV